MNILVVNWTWFPSGGDWTYIENVSRLYEENGHTVVPFSMQDERNLPTPYQKYFVSHINYKALNANRKLSSGLQVLSKSIYSYEAKEKLEALLSEVDIQLAHLNLIHHYITPSILSVLKKRNIPVLWTLHDYSPICPQGIFVSNDKICESCKGNRFYNTLLKKCKKNSLLASSIAMTENYIHHLKGYYNDVDYFVCPSLFTYEKYRAFNFFSHKLHHLYHGYYFDDNMIQKPVIAGNTKEKYIVFVGRLERIKGVHTLLKAMETLPDIKLKIIGKGSEENALREMALNKRLSQVEFLGERKKEEVLGIVNNALFLVCPSECYEVLGFTIVEAMFLGKPVIGSNIGAIPETVIHEHTGLLFEMGNAADLSEKITRLYADESLIKELGANAKSHVSHIFNPKAHFEGLKKIIPIL